MRAVLQRVSRAQVEVAGAIVGEIGRGLLVYLGVGRGDSEKDIAWLAEKIVNLRVFADENDKMNRSVQDIGGEILLVSQFTLYGDCRKGRRPSFDPAAEPALAEKLYEKMVEAVKNTGISVKTGIFGAKMAVFSLNDGPVTFIIESPERGESPEK